MSEEVECLECYKLFLKDNAQDEYCDECEFDFVLEDEEALFDIEHLLLDLEGTMDQEDIDFIEYLRDTEEETSV